MCHPFVMMLPAHGAGLDTRECEIWSIVCPLARASCALLCMGGPVLGAGGIGEAFATALTITLTGALANALANPLARTLADTLAMPSDAMHSRVRCGTGRSAIGDGRM